MGEMTAYSIEDLVRQAESEGVTLAEIMSRTMSNLEMDDLEAELRSKIDENYASIESFMSDVEIPSLPNLSDLSHDELAKMQDDILSVLSDESSVASS